MEIEETVDVFLLYLEEHNDVTGPVHLVLDNFLEELFYHLDVLLGFFVENLCDCHRFLVVADLLFWHRGEALYSGLIDLWSLDGNARLGGCLFFVGDELN
jgi:hypothetical protein